MVSQVPVVGILMIVNGALAGLLGIGVAAMGPVLFALISRQGPAPPPQAAQMLNVMSMVYLVYGSAILIAGVLNVIGGIRALAYRNRAFVIVALFFNLIPIMTCYCMPTSVGLMIYGLIVMFQGDVGHAFAMVEEGYPPSQVQQELGRDQSYRRDDERWRSRRLDADVDSGLDSPPEPRDRPRRPGPGSDDDQFYER